MVLNSPGPSPKVRPGGSPVRAAKCPDPRLLSPSVPTLSPCLLFFFFLLILNNGISVCLRLNHVDPPSFPFLFIQFPTPLLQVLLPFLLEKEREKKNFPRSRKLIIVGFDFQPFSYSVSLMIHICTLPFTYVIFYLKIIRHRLYE